MSWLTDLNKASSWSFINGTKKNISAIPSTELNYEIDSKLGSTILRPDEKISQIQSKKNNKMPLIAFFIILFVFYKGI